MARSQQPRKVYRLHRDNSILLQSGNCRLVRCCLQLLRLDLSLKCWKCEKPCMECKWHSRCRMVRQGWWCDIKGWLISDYSRLMAVIKTKELCFGIDLPHRKRTCSIRIRRAQPVLSWCQEWLWPLNRNRCQALPRLAAKLGLLGRWRRCIHLPVCWLHTSSTSSIWWRWQPANCPWPKWLRRNSTRFCCRRSRCSVPSILINPTNS